MANPEHVAIVRQGITAIQQFKRSFEALDLSDARLDGIHLVGAPLCDVNFSGASLVGAYLSGAYLHGAKFSGADLTNAFLRNTVLSRADLRRANLRGADLSNSWLNHTIFDEADLEGAAFTGAQLVSTMLFDANLRNVDFTNANILDALLIRANLQGARLESTVFRRSSLAAANLSECLFSDTTIAYVDLSSTDGLATVIHKRPSTIGTDTLYISRGKIPEAFLRGCGVPDALIANLPALIGAQEPIQFYSCFISYSHQDEAFAQRLHAGLQQKGLRVWYAPDDMKLGQKIHEQIESAIRIHDKLLLVLSEASMNSEWVKTEIAHARQREVAEGKRVLFPISLVPFDAIRAWKAFDADTGKDMAREIREYLVGDFSNWKDHDSFEKGFERLLRDLRAEGAKESGAAPCPLSNVG